MKAHPLKIAVTFYLESRRRLGFALESDGALLANLVAYARHVQHRGPLTAELALNWAQLPPPTKPLRRARRLAAVRHFAIFWAAFDPRTQIRRRVSSLRHTAVVLSYLHALRDQRPRWRGGAIGPAAESAPATFARSWVCWLHGTAGSRRPSSCSGKIGRPRRC
jgi:hypothetical protein